MIRIKEEKQCTFALFQELVRCFKSLHSCCLFHSCLLRIHVSYSKFCPKSKKDCLREVHTTTRLELASGGDGGGSTTTTDGTGGGTASLDGLDDGHGGDVTVGDLTEDDVTAVEPAGDDGGDEELRAVAVWDVRHVLARYEGSKHTCWGRRWPWRA
jgi:hypothetical protein